MRSTALGIHFIEAGFPSSNPKEEALFELLAGERFENAADLRLRHDAAARRGRRRGPGAAAAGGVFAPVCTLVGKTWKLHLEKVIHTDPQENLDLIARLGRTPGRAQGKRVIYDAEHFFDAYRDDPEYALRCLGAALEAGAENVTLCDTNGSSLPPQVAEATAPRSSRGSAPSGSGIHTHNDAECGVANSLAAVEQGASPRAGHDERRRRALRQREPRLDPARRCS